MIPKLSFFFFHELKNTPKRHTSSLFPPYRFMVLADVKEIKFYPILIILTLRLAHYNLRTFNYPIVIKSLQKKNIFSSSFFCLKTVFVWSLLQSNFITFKIILKLGISHQIGPQRLPLCQKKIRNWLTPAPPPWWLTNYVNGPYVRTT